MLDGLRRYHGPKAPLNAVALVNDGKPASRPIAWNALYDPLRDGPPRYKSPFSAALGDPPIGRRELLAWWSAHHPDGRRRAEEWTL
jgi:hypothetical protein